MSRGRDFIKRQDDEMEASLKAWEKNAKAFLMAAKADANLDVQRERLREWHAAAQDYFRKVDECVSDAGELSGPDYENWLQSRTNTALSGVSGFLTQIGDVREQREKLGMHHTVFEPSPGFLAHAQSLVAATRPESAKKFKQEYLEANLSIDGFDNPRVPTASPCEEKADLSSAPASVPAHYRPQRGPLDIANTAVWIVGIMMFACIVSGIFIGALALFFFIILLTSGLSLACIAGGAFAVWKGSTAHTKFKMLGVNLDTKSVGVGIIAIGLIVGYFTVDSVLKRVDLLEGHKQNATLKDKP